MSHFATPDSSGEQPKDRKDSGAVRFIRKYFGRQAVVFLLFLFISTILWFIMSLNETLQRDLECQIKIVNVPDSVTFITDAPKSVTVNVSGRGTSLVKYQLGSVPVLEIDYNKYRHGSDIDVSRKELLSVIQRELGNDVKIQRMDLDSLNIVFTTLPGVSVPVLPEVTVHTVINSRMTGSPQTRPEKVMIYSTTREGLMMDCIKTETANFRNIKESFSRRLKLITPPGTRAVPDSVEIFVDIEPLLTRSAEVIIETINMPDGIKIIPNPASVRVDYLVPASTPDYRPELHVIADFMSLNGSLASDRIGIRLKETDVDAYLSVDSVEYLVEIMQTDNSGNDD